MLSFLILSVTCKHHLLVATRKTKNGVCSFAPSRINLEDCSPITFSNNPSIPVSTTFDLFQTIYYLFWRKSCSKQWGSICQWSWFLWHVSMPIIASSMACEAFLATLVAVPWACSSLFRTCLEALLPDLSRFLLSTIGVQVLAIN